MPRLPQPAVFSALAALVVLLFGLPAHAAEPLRPGDAARLTEARSQLEQALSVLAAAPTDGPSPAARSAQDALRRIEALVDSYHHAPNLRAAETRAHALAMRPVVGRLIAPGGPLVLVDDVLHPSPAVAGALADAARRAGDRDGQIRWLRAALAASTDDRALLVRLRDALLAAGDLKGANAIAARLNPPPSGTVSAPKSP